MLGLRARAAAPSPSALSAAPPRRPPALARRPGSSRRLLGVRLVTALSVLLSCASALAGWGFPPSWAPLLVLVAWAISDTAAGVVAPSRPRVRTVAGATTVAAALALRPGSWLVPVVLISAAACALARGGRPATVIGEALRPAAGTGAAVVVVHVLAHFGDAPLLSAAVGTLVWWAVTYLLAAVTAALGTGRKLRSMVLTGAPESLLAAVGGGAVGLPAAFLAVHAPAGLLGLLAPGAALWSSARDQGRQAATSVVVAELARTAAQERGDAASADTAARTLVTAAARLLGGADVELLLLAPDGPVRYAGDEQATDLRERVSLQAFDDPWIHRALGGRGTASGRSAEGRPVVSATVRGPASAHAQAALVVRRPPGAATFTRSDRAIVRALVLHAAGSLWPARMTAATHAAGNAVPRGDARVALRDAAQRLARLADAPEVGRDGSATFVACVVDELHATERAVASLVGELAGQEPESSGVPAQRVAGDEAALPGDARDEVRDEEAVWTTTGSLPPADYA